MSKYRKIAQLRDPESLRDRLDELNVQIPVHDQVLSREQGSPLACIATVGRLSIKNRWCIQPMEGWDANLDGSPSDLTLRRWQRFGLSGAALIWGGEAAAVRPDGRANPHQTMAIKENTAGIMALRQALFDSHRQQYGNTEGLVLGLQLTHSGRFCRPNRKDLLEPRIAYHHPLLDSKFGIDPSDDSVLWTDGQLQDLIQQYVSAARVAWEAGFDFVDVKACHGYLLHEFLSARVRQGIYGGDLQGRSRLLLEIVDAIHRDCPGLSVGVRLSLFDFVPFEPSSEEGESNRTGRPSDFESILPYRAGFGCKPDNPLEIDLAEPVQLIQTLGQHGVRLFNLTCGSPYYNPHIQRPAIFPPSDGYLPPEDPLVGVARQISAAAEIKRAFPEFFFVGSGYTYLQDFLPNVAQAVISQGMIDSVGLGRMVLSYPEMPEDVLSGRAAKRKLICRTFSDCTTAPRNGLVSGCYPLDAFYKVRPEREKLKDLKQS